MLDPTDGGSRMAGERLAFVVDDEEEVRAFVSRILKTEGFHTMRLGSCGEVTAALADTPPDLIVLDLSLGTSDAVEVIRILASAAYKGDVILISGHDSGTLDEVAEIGRRRGLSMLSPLTKPFRVNDMRARLKHLSSHTQPLIDAASLQSALKNNWLEVWYQPKIDIRTRAICGAEALVRMRHPSQGLLGPGQFLPAPGDPLFAPLTDFIVQQALADWQLFARYQMTNRLAVNVPASVLQRQDFVTNLRANLPTDKNFPGLIVEITEDEAIRDPILAREISIQLKLYNIHVSIDDFGQGFSQLARLQELPFAEIKLDRAFVSGCTEDAEKQSMCRSVAELARRFNITAVAEGVETREDLDTVAAIGYDVAQGFLFARPMPSSELLRRLAGEAVPTEPAQSAA